MFKEFEAFMKQREEANQKVNTTEANEIVEIEEGENDEFVLGITVEEKTSKAAATKIHDSITLFEKLTDMKIQNTVNMQLQINEYSLLFDEFKKVNSEISDTLKIAFVANKLPENYSQSIQLIDQIPNLT